MDEEALIFKNHGAEDRRLKEDADGIDLREVRRACARNDTILHLQQTSHSVNRGVLA